MPEFLIDEIAEASRLRRYHVRAEFQPAFVMEGEIDLDEESGHITLSQWSDDTPTAEAYWSDTTAVGHRVGSDRWLRVTRMPPVILLPAIADLLESAPIASVEEEGPYWLIGLERVAVPAVEDAEEFFREILGEPSNDRGRETPQPRHPQRRRIRAAHRDANRPRRPEIHPTRHHRPRPRRSRAHHRNRSSTRTSSPDARPRRRDR